MLPRWITAARLRIISDDVVEAAIATDPCIVAGPGGLPGIDAQPLISPSATASTSALAELTFVLRLHHAQEVHDAAEAGEQSPRHVWPCSRWSTADHRRGPPRRGTVYR